MHICKKRTDPRIVVEYGSGIFFHVIIRKKVAKIFYYKYDLAGLKPSQMRVASPFKTMQRTA